MNLARVEMIAKAVLYEGYMLYPYRPSSVKNRQRFNFGVLYPQSYSESQDGADPCSLRTECPIKGNAETIFEGRLRFLHLQARSGNRGALPVGWQEAVECDIGLPTSTLGELALGNSVCAFAFPATSGEVHQEAIEGTVSVSALRAGEQVFKVSVDVRNTTALEAPISARDAALMRSLVSTHTILGVKGGEFISLLEPPDEFKQLAASCANVGVWPVLVGDSGERDTMLASPIILYDYPQIAPESAGDLFDGTEIDEILSLRIMTLTDEEKKEICQSDERARQILERTEAMPAEQFMKMHGAVRGLRPCKEGL